ncbi:MAG: efflux RND transporter periplasmic adaptor subunit [Armatimonadetes bacterium]|nr:efflux RND transporter periplasmic adaptor subunit [Armatimonadota bacterium]
MKRSTLAVVLAVVVVLVAIGLWSRSRPRRGGNPGALQTVAVERGTVRQVVSADGTIQPLTTVGVTSYAGGRVDVLAVEVGDVVKLGDLIAKIDPTDSLTAYNQAEADLTAAQARLRQAKAQSKVQPTLTRASIAQAEANHDSTVKDLERLTEATHPQARVQARSALDKARANVEIAEKELVRAQGLKAKGFVPQGEVDTAVNRRELAKAELSSAQQQWDTLEQQLGAELASAEARVAQAQASLDRARAEAVQDQLREADVASAQAQVARVEAQVVNATAMLDYTTITAPREGVILQKLVEEGSMVTSGRSSVTQGTDIVLLGDLTQMFVEVSLDEADVGRVRVGHPAEITIDAFPDEQFLGEITRVDPQAATTQNVTTVLVKVRIEGADPRVKPGMTASCDFVVMEAKDVLRLPNRVVQRERGEAGVLVQRGTEPTRVPVEVGVVGDEYTEIREGLKEGDEVVVAAPTGGSNDWSERARERGRQMGGAGGFVRENR